MAVSTVIDIQTVVDRRLRHRWRADKEQIHCTTPPLSTTSLKHIKRSNQFNEWTILRI